MIVICKKNTKRLVKGLRYEVHALYNSGNNQRWIEGKLKVKGFGRFVVSNFTDIDGKPVPSIDIIPPRPQFNRLEFSDLKKGDIIVCTSDSYKTLIKNGMYKIEELIQVSSERKYHSGQSYTHREQSIKFEGISRKLKFSSWRFRTLTAHESRELSLSSLLEGKEADIIKSSKIRKIDMVTNKKLELMRNLALSILDNNRHHLSIVDWSCQKIGSKLGIESSDYSELMNMTLKDILEKIESK
jgi:hypothetical protein